MVAKPPVEAFLSTIEPVNYVFGGKWLRRGKHGSS
jgi:hypothetical protein